MTHENAPSQAPFQAKGEDRHARPKPQLASDKVQYFGEPVALVVAETAEGARAAAQAVTVTYEPAKGAFVLELASHDAYDPKKSGNGSPSDSQIGIFDSAFEIAPVRVDAVYRTPYQSHAMMEPHASLASWDGDKLTVRSALQLVESAHKSIADTLKLAPDKVEVISEYVGGGFGGKLPVNADAILAALASRELKRPVRIVLSRQQMFHVTTHRPASIQRVRLGAERDGTLTAIAHQSLAQSCAGRRVLRTRRQRHAFALCRAQPADQPAHRRPRPAGGRRHARAGRGDRHAGARAGDGRAGAAPRHRPGRAAHPQRTEAGPREERAVLDARAGAVPAGRRAPLRLGQAQSPAGPACATDTGWSAWAWPPPAAATSCGRPRPG